MTILKKTIRSVHIAKVKLLRMFSAKRRNMGPASGTLKWAAIEAMRKKTGINTFVETGTYRGDTVEHFKNSFKKIYSIELGSELAAEAKRKFSSIPHISIVEGDSALVLPKILAEVKMPALFWLDAHCSEGDTVQGSDYSPITSELTAILKDPQPHAILIDDARLFDGVNYPTLGTIKRIVRKIRPEFSSSVENDITHIYQDDKS